MKNKTLYFPGLNGLRAIAALAVVVSHISLALKQFDLDPYILGANDDGNPMGLAFAGYGVSIFFVLSGFLITYLLQAEKEISGINVKKFYIRRILRIWPLYYLYLIIAVLTILLFNHHSDFRSLTLYILFAANVPFILNTALPLLSHYWSLGVEEQFYLFWPWVNKKVGFFLIPLIIGLIAVLIGTKLLLHFFYPDSLLESAIHVTRFHCMLIGAWSAILYKQGNGLFLKITDNKIAQSICWIMLILAVTNRFSFASVIDNEIISIITLIIIIGQINVTNRIVNLEINILDFLGKISYGIYIIHPLLIFLFAKAFPDLTIRTTYKYILVYSIIISTTIILSYLSYRYVEQYFLRIKKRFVIVNSSPTKHFKD